jgi:TRAP-type C4-dicarboxylate transport system substrate-binding protein
MIRVTRIITAAALLFLFGAGFCFSQKIPIKIASIAPNNSPWDVEQKKLAMEWSRITGGRITVQYFNTNTLGGEYAVIQKMRSVRPGQRSAIDGAIFTNMGLYELAPKTEIYTLSLPFLFRDQNEVDYALEYFSPRLEKAVSDAGYKLMGWFNIGWITFFTRDEIHSVADLKKVKLSGGGVDSPVLSNAFKASGYMTEDVSSDKISQSLKSASGIRGFYSLPMYAYATQYSKSINYALDAHIIPILAALVISEKTWTTIPDEFKPAMLKAVDDAKDNFLSVQKNTDREYLNIMEKEGVTLIKFTDADRQRWETDFSKDIPAITKGPGAAINAEFLQEIRTLMDNYRAGKR